MNNLEPVSVMLKFGFLIVLYLFLLWVSRSALRDLRGSGAGGLGGPPTRMPRPRTPPACTPPPRSAPPTCAAAHRGWWWSAPPDTTRA